MSVFSFVFLQLEIPFLVRQIFLNTTNNHENKVILSKEGEMRFLYFSSSIIIYVSKRFKTAFHILHLGF